MREKLKSESSHTVKDLHLCTRVRLLKGPADATVAVNSPPVATAHHLIDYAALETLDQSSSFPYVWQLSIANLPESREYASKAWGPFPLASVHLYSPPPFSPLLSFPLSFSLTSDHNKSKAGKLNCFTTTLVSKTFGKFPNLLCWLSCQHIVKKKKPTMQKTNDLKMTLHQKSIYSWFFTLPQKVHVVFYSLHKSIFRTYNTSVSNQQ